MSRTRIGLLMLATLIAGIVIGGYLFSNSRPRSFLALNKCEGTCLDTNELLGLAASVGIQRFSALAPKVVVETDKTIVIEHPSPQAALHYLVIPKRDLKNIAEFTDADRDNLVDAFKVIGEIVRSKNLKNYRVTTNGPGFQTATYLHFHLTAN